MKLKKPLSLVAGILVLASVSAYIIENEFTGLVLALNMIAIALFFIDNRKVNRKK